MATTNNETVSNEPIKQNKVSFAKKEAMKKYAAKNPEKIREIRHNYYYRQKAKKEAEKAENIKIKQELEELRARVANL